MLQTEAEPRIPRTGAVTRRRAAPVPEIFQPFEACLATLRAAAVPVERAFSLYARSQDGVVAELLEDPQLRAAIAVASPSLRRAIDDARSGIRPLTQKAASKIFSYAVRRACRPTPFGLFAGVALVDRSGAFDMRLERFEPRARLSAEWLGAEADDVERRGEAIEELRLVANQYAIESGDRIYVSHPDQAQPATAREIGFDNRSYSVRNSKAVRTALQLSASPRAGADLIDSLAAAFETERDAAREFVRGLLDAGLLLFVLRPSNIGNPLAEYLANLGSVTSGAKERVVAAAARVDRLNADLAHAGGFTRIADVQDELAAVHDIGTALQVDARWHVSGGISPALEHDLTRLANVMIVCGRVMSIQPYADAFITRYNGREAVVPLVELIDEEFGLGSPPDVELLPHPRADQIQSSFSERLVLALKAPEFEIRLNDEDLDKIFGHPRTEIISETVDLCVSVLARDAAAVRVGEYELAVTGTVAYNEAGESAARFDHLFPDGALADRIRAASRELGPGDDHAELVYAPVVRKLGNVVTRPRVWPRRIDFGGFAADGTAIDPRELDVTLDEDGRFVVLWRRTGRPLTVHETHALNTNRGGPAVSRFLTLARKHGLISMGSLAWQELFAHFSAFPRVRYGRYILSPSYWRLHTSAFKGSDALVQDNIDVWRAKYRVPRWVNVADHDVRLTVDLESPAALPLLRDVAAGLASSGRALVMFDEVLHTPENSWLQGPDAARYASELFVGFRKSSPAVRRTATVGSVHADRAARRAFPPGSEWLYLKVYAGRDRLENFVAEELPRLVASVGAALDTWFFVRYGEGGEHVRLRIKVKQSPEALLVAVVRALQGLADRRAIDRFAVDTYEREIERYGGGELIDWCERLFSFSSTDYCARAKRSGGAERLEDAVGTFLPVAAAFGASAPGGPRDLVRNAERKLPAAAREGVRRLFGTAVDRENPRYRVAAHVASGTPDPHSLLDSLFHMHCNRFGLRSRQERIARAMLRRWLIGYEAQNAVR